MSATRDKSQKTTFVYSNLYSLYRKGKEAAAQSNVSEAPSAEPAYFAMPSERNVLKTADLKREAGVKIEAYKPTELLSKRIEANAAIAAQQASVRIAAVAPARLPAGKPTNSTPDAALSSLKQNLQSLQDLHSRLRFMLKELEELSQDE